MIILEGKYNKAKVFTENIENTAISQIIELCNQEFVKNSKIRIMPDVHSGAGCTIGTTMTIKDKIVPNLVGVDIGCGMLTIKLKEKEIDYNLLDRIIKENISIEREIIVKENIFTDFIDLRELKCSEFISLKKSKLSFSTIGNGNHFIEINKDKKENLYLVIHSGSRHLGKQVAVYYQNLAIKRILDKEREEFINKLKTDGKEKEIQKILKNYIPVKVESNLACLQGNDFDNYIHDMKIVQKFASLNRESMAEDIIKALKLTVIDKFETVHNYIDTNNMILRKGSISANKNEKVLIPINMRDGSIIAIGKGNEDWNYSAPHGAGRLFSRGKSKELITLEQFKESMKGIYSITINESTINESPMAYKPLEEIVKNIKDTVEIIDIIKPIYNFKS